MKSNAERVGHTITIVSVHKQELYDHVETVINGCELKCLVSNDPIRLEEYGKRCYQVLNFFVNDEQLNQTEFNEKYFQFEDYEPNSYDLWLMISDKKGIPSVNTDKYFMIYIYKNKFDSIRTTII
jgi:hypothetical protein